jgi:hypothetical protein
VQRVLDEARPHAAVDRGGLGTLDHEWAQRAGRGHDHGLLGVDGSEYGVEPELADCRTDGLESLGDVGGRPELGARSEPAPESATSIAERGRVTIVRYLVEELGDELRQMVGGELEGLGLRSGCIELRRPAGARPATAGATLEPRLHETHRDEPLEPAARDVAVDAEGLGRLVDAERTASPPDHEERRPEDGAAECVELVRHHRTLYNSSKWL